MKVHALSLVLVTLLTPALHAQSTPELPSVPAGDVAVPAQPEPAVPTLPDEGSGNGPALPPPRAPFDTTPLPSPVQERSSAPALSVLFTEYLPIAVDGRKAYELHTRSLDLGQARSDVLRAQGKITTTLRGDVERFARSLERPAQDARFEFDPSSGRWRLVVRPSVQVDLQATLASVEAALADPAASRVNVVYSRTLPRRTLDFFIGKGVTSLLGEGVTSYAGSSNARRTNIHVGASRFQDVLFEGRTLSFNTLVGPITARQGFVPGLVIAGDRTATGVGGGICQVSTTVFRTLYSAGLPVLERRNHSYQVRYYEPVGLDAAIYQPTQDLKFENDTGGPLWFQAEWDDRQGNLVVRAFGRPRAQRVQVSEPRVLDTQPPPPSRLIVDPTLPAGRRVQVDWAAPGATVEVERVFLDGATVVRRETLRSVYRAWPDIFLIGPS